MEEPLDFPDGFIFRLLHPVSVLRFDEDLIPELRLPASGFRLQASDFWLQASNFRLPASDFRLLSSGFQLQLTTTTAY